MVTVSVPPLRIPPPSTPVVLPDKVLWSTVSVPKLTIPPPGEPTLFPAVITRPLSVTVPEVISNTCVMMPPPLMRTGAARAEPSMVKFWAMVRVPRDKVMVCEERPEAKVAVSPLAAAAMASRSEQSASQTPSSVSAVLVTTGCAV